MSWGSWLANAATSAVGEVTQFGKDVLDSVTSVEEEDDVEHTRSRVAARDGGGNNPPAASTSGHRQDVETEGDGANWGNDNWGDEGESDTVKPPTASASSTTASRHVDPTASSLRGAEEPVVAPAVAVAKKPAAKQQQSGKIRKKGLGAKLVATPTNDGSAKQFNAEETSPEQSAAKPKPVEEEKPKPPAAKDDDGWGMSMGFGLVSKGADLALQLLPDLDSPSREAAAATAEQEEEDAVSSPAVVKAVVDKAPQQVDPLELLRNCRGNVELKRQLHPDESTQSKLSEDFVTELLDPLSLSEFEYEPEMKADVEWVGKCSVGRRIHTTRLMTTEVKDENGEPLGPDAVVELMNDFPATATTSANAIADIVLEELADVYAKGITSDCDWFNHNRKTLAKDSEESVKQMAQNTKDLLTFAQCEMAEGSKTLSDLVQECFLWAKKAEVPNVKQIKEKSLSVRGECFVSGTEAIGQLEEALECVLVLFPYPASSGAAKKDEQLEEKEVVEEGEEDASSPAEIPSTPTNALECSPSPLAVPPPTPAKPGTTMLVPLPPTDSSSPSSSAASPTRGEQLSVTEEPATPPQPSPVQLKVPPPTPADAATNLLSPAPSSSSMDNSTPASPHSPPTGTSSSAASGEATPLRPPAPPPTPAKDGLSLLMPPTPPTPATPSSEAEASKAEEQSDSPAATNPKETKSDEQQDVISPALTASTAPSDSPASASLEPAAGDGDAVPANKKRRGKGGRGKKK